MFSPQKAAPARVFHLRCLLSQPQIPRPGGASRRAAGVREPRLRSGVSPCAPSSRSPRRRSRRVAAPGPGPARRQPRGDGLDQGKAARGSLRTSGSAAPPRAAGGAALPEERGWGENASPAWSRISPSLQNVSPSRGDSCPDRVPRGQTPQTSVLLAPRSRCQPGMPAGGSWATPCPPRVPGERGRSAAPPAPSAPSWRRREPAPSSSPLTTPRGLPAPPASP